MEFKACLAAELENNSVIEPQDVVKFCYQAAFGAEHLLADEAAAWRFLETEFASLPDPAKERPLITELSSQVCRIDLMEWKKRQLPSIWLFRMFVHSAQTQGGGSDLFAQYLMQAEELLAGMPEKISRQEWDAFLANYRAGGMTAVHHSEGYRRNTHPAYRIVDTAYLPVLPLLEKAAELAAREPGRKVIAIDGPCASGKSTLAQKMQEILQAGVVHMDDFFLPQFLRSEARYREPGGNIHYERFAREVLPHLRDANPFSYEIYDCHKGGPAGQRTVTGEEWRIVEGSYSMHPAFGNYADLRVFLTISLQEQLARIEGRNGMEMAKIFKEKWIPLENLYFETCKISEKAEVLLQMGQKKEERTRTERYE